MVVLHVCFAMLQPTCMAPACEQDQFMAVITEPGAGDKEVTDMFTFWRPTPHNSRKSAILHMTDKQLDIMYALAGEGVHVHCASLALSHGRFTGTHMLAMAGLGDSA